MSATLEQRQRSWRVPVWFGACVFLAIAVFFLWEEHRAHLLGALPWLLLLACPLMHFLMHRGHRSHQRGQAPGSGEEHAGHGCG